MADFFSDRASFPFTAGQPGMSEGQFFPQDAITAHDPFDAQRPEILAGDDAPLITATEEDEESASQFPAADSAPLPAAAAIGAGPAQPDKVPQDEASQAANTSPPGQSNPKPEQQPELPPAGRAVSAPLGELAVDPSRAVLSERPEPEPAADQLEPVTKPHDQASHTAPDAVAEATNDTVVTDPELAGLLTQGIEVLGEAGLDRVLRANDRFNQTTIVMHEDGSETVDEQYSNRQLLREIPDYVAAATEAGLEPEQAQSLLVHTLDSFRYMDDHSDRTTAYLTRAIGTAANAGEPLTEANVQQLKDLIATAGEDDAIRPSLRAYRAARQAGLSSEDSVEIVKDYLASQNYRQVGYTMHRFTGALSTLKIAGVDPELVKETFAAFKTVHPELRSVVYDEFKDLIATGVPVMGKTATELMQATVGQLRAGAADMHDAIGRVVRGDGEPASIGNDAPVVIDPAERRDKHFIPVSGPLEHAALPYRTERSLNDGVRDIEKLTGAKSYLGDTVSEGAWVYSPEKNTWYSLGGETEFLGGGDVRHTHTHFDSSELSETPLVFHIHPEEAGFGREKIGHVFPSNADYRMVATIQENARRPVTPRSFISHSLGITEFTFPNDSQAIRAVSEVAQATRDSLFARFGDEWSMMQQARAVGEYDFAQWCVGQINAALPDGFNIVLHPRGVDLEQIVGRARPPEEP